MCNTLSDFSSMVPGAKAKQPAAAPAPASTSTSSAAGAATIAAGTAAAAAASAAPSDYKACPPDGAELGRSTWTFLHSLAATYPETASPAHQSQMSSFLSIFSSVYPCWHCASDLRDWIAAPEPADNKPKLAGREDFGQWLCRAHNEVNRKLGKPEFDCGDWRKRWVDGWNDGRCD